MLVVEELELPWLLDVALDDDETPTLSLLEDVDELTRLLVLELFTVVPEVSLLKTRVCELSESLSTPTAISSKKKPA